MIDQAIYKLERAICDKALSYANTTMERKSGKFRRYYLTKEEAAHPDYAACNNAMRGRVEQFEILRDLPDTIFAYLEYDKDDSRGSRLAVSVWTGDSIGMAQVETVSSRANRCGERQRYGKAVIGGKAYRWQGQGSGVYAIFKALKRAV